MFDNGFYTNGISISAKLDEFDCVMVSISSEGWQ